MAAVACATVLAAAPAAGAAGAVPGAVSGAGAVTGATGAAPSDARAPEPDCPPTWDWPTISGGVPEFSDHGIALLVGGDLLVQGGAAEAEGRLLVHGSTTIDRSPAGLFNVGRVGAGSQVAPIPGTAMLLTGSSRADDLTLTPGNRLEVGHGLATGGDVRVGGELVPSVQPVETNGGAVTYRMGAAATADYAGLTDDLRRLSEQLAGLPANGETVVRGNRLQFTGTGEPGVPQVFDLDAAAFGSGGHEQVWRDIPERTPVVVNVTGTSARVDALHVSDDGVRADDLASPRFPAVAVRTMWNFPDATRLDLAGTGQLLGSVLALSADVEISSSTNGRLYLGGDVRMAGTHNELHNYHWAGHELTVCEPDPGAQEPTGAVTVGKVLDGDAALLPEGLTFSGAILCDDGVAPPVVERWELAAGETAAYGNLPLGTRCRVTEFTPPEVPGLTWAEPVLDPPGGEVVATADGAAARLTVTNQASAPFTVVKQVAGPDGAGGLVDAGGTFTVHHVCTSAGRPVDGRDADGVLVPGSATGTSHLRDGEPVESLAYPLGTVCELTEDLTDAPGLADGWAWSAVEVLPDRHVVVGADGHREVRVVNTVASATAPQGTFAVTKRVTGPGGFTGGGRAFAVDHACTLDGAPALGHDPDDLTAVVAPDGTGRLLVRADGTTRSPAFPVGTECHLTEDLTSEPGDFAGDLHWTGATFTPGRTVVVGTDATDGATAPVQVELVNTYGPNDEPLAPFEVTKQVVGPDGTDAALLDRDRAFTVEYRCTRDGAPSTGWSADGVEVLAPHGTGRLEVQASGRVTSPSFARGTTCVLEEHLVPSAGDLRPGHQWSGATFEPGATVTIGDGRPVQVLLVNHVVPHEPEPAPATFSVTKVVQGPVDGVVDPAATFAFPYTCTRDGAPSPGRDDAGTLVAPHGTGTLEVRAGETVRAPWFPTGTTCTVAGDLDGIADDALTEGFAWHEVVLSRPMPIELGVLHDAPVEVAATNRFRAEEPGVEGAGGSGEEEPGGSGGDGGAPGPGGDGGAPGDGADGAGDPGSSGSLARTGTGVAAAAVAAVVLVAAGAAARAATLRRGRPVSPVSPVSPVRPVSPGRRRTPPAPRRGG